MWKLRPIEARIQACEVSLKNLWFLLCCFHKLGLMESEHSWIKSPNLNPELEFATLYPMHVALYPCLHLFFLPNQDTHLRQPIRSYLALRWRHR